MQRPEDVAEVKELVRGRAGILSKIEKPAALECLDQILELSDALMVARGDLGVELPLERVPGIQNASHVATQIRQACCGGDADAGIDDHIAHTTRAEVSDVATAVYEGADAVMLSAESAAGQYPVEAVETMDKIAREVERDRNYRTIISAQRTEPEPTGADAISEAARTIAERLQLAAFICYTASGSTALRVARERPNRPVIALTPSLPTSPALSLVWDLHCVAGEEPTNLDDMINLHAAWLSLKDLQKQASV